MTIDLNYHHGRTVLPIARRRQTSFRIVSENNPCYLLSAACMLLGLRILSESISLVALIGTLNLYEAMLITMALWLLVRRKIVRDSEILLAIEALFIADTALLSSQLFTGSLSMGLLVNGVLLIAMIGKLWLIAWTLQLPIARTLRPMIALQTLVYAVPALCKWASLPQGGKLPPMILYAVWWIALFVPAIFNAILRIAAPVVSRRVAITFGALAAFSVIFHLAIVGWVYKLTWYPAHLAPLILGIAIVIKPLRWRVLAPLAAVAVSLSTPDALSVGAHFAITPLRCALIGAAAMHATLFITDRRIRFAIFAMIDLIMALLGATVGQIVDRLSAPVNEIFSSAGDFFPRTMKQWGMVAIASTFVLLFIGMVISVNRGAEDVIDEAQEKARS